jgi:hypothetical protein
MPVKQLKRVESTQEVGSLLHYLAVGEAVAA